MSSSNKSKDCKFFGEALKACEKAIGETDLDLISALPIVSSRRLPFGSANRGCLGTFLRSGVFNYFRPQPA